MSILQDQTTRFFEVLAASKLPSELGELLTSPSATHFVVIQSGTNDAKKISVANLRGALGTYNATTNTPSLINSAGVEGDSYLVSVAGTKDFGNGNINLSVNDLLEYRGGKWIKFNQVSLQNVLDALGYTPANDAEVVKSLQKFDGTPIAKDANGLVVLPDFSVWQAPFLNELIPDTYLPSTTGNFILNGSFFTPNMTVVVEGHTINYKTFISDSRVLINLTTSATEGTYDVTLNNGIEAVFLDRLQVVQGTVYKPVTADWTLTEPINVTDSEVNVQTWNSAGTAKWSKLFDFTINWSLKMRIKATPLGNSYPSNYDQRNISLKNISDVSRTYVNFYTQSATSLSLLVSIDGVASTNKGILSTNSPAYFADNLDIFEYRCIAGVLYLYKNNTLISNMGAITENLYLFITLSIFDVYDIKYIDLSDGSGALQDVRTKTSELQNDGEDGSSPYATLNDIQVAGAVTDTISFAISDTSSALVAGDVDSFHAPYNFTLSTFWVGVNTAPTGSALVADVKKAGVSITSSKAIIDAAEFTSLTGTAPVLTTTTFLKGDKITPVISQVGSIETGKSLKLYLEITKN
jgi:hypothetical protein